MSSGEEEDDLFGDDSDDTAELIAAASKKKPAAAAAKKKKAAAPKKKVTKKTPDADSDGGLFDSDSDDDDDGKPKAKKPAAAAKPTKALSKREKMEALAKRKKADTAPTSSSKRGDNSNTDNDKKKNDNTSSNILDRADIDNDDDSVDSADIQRTAEDDAFIDTTGEDADAVNELYAEQHFDDEEQAEDMGKKKKKKRKIRMDDGTTQIVDDVTGINAEPDNPIMAAVHRMKKKKREKKTLTEMEDEIKDFLQKMEMAADVDETSVAARKPALQKLNNLNDMCDMLAKRDMWRLLLDFDLLTTIKRWIQPLPNGTLGNVTVRQRIIDSISKMKGETGINANDLKRSELGRTIMTLYKHKSETPTMKRQLKNLIEQWSRPIFQKSGNMRDLERVSRGTSEGLAALARQNAATAAGGGAGNAAGYQRKNSTGSGNHDINSIIKSGKKSSIEAGAGTNRVRVPYSKGFAYSVRPMGRDHTPAQVQAQQRSMPKENRDKLAKRMVEKGRTVSKNQRSANISIEGRKTK